MSEAEKGSLEQHLFYSYPAARDFKTAHLQTPPKAMRFSNIISGTENGQTGEETFYSSIPNLYLKVIFRKDEDGHIENSAKLKA